MTIPILRLHEGDAPFRSDPAESFTIPARFYHDAGVHEAEKTAIFYRNWWFCGHRSQLPQPGNYITTKVMDQNIVVVRTRDGSLKAYYNVCQHRGHELVQGSGKTVMLTCPYHAWAYDLDGQLRSARNTERMAGFKACEFALKPVRVEEYCGLVSSTSIRMRFLSRIRQKGSVMNSGITVRKSSRWFLRSGTPTTSRRTGSF